MRLGLALSGGGLRATLFHLGVVKALQRHGVLENVTHITSVSGGSILAAHLVKNWSAYLDDGRFGGVAQQIIDFSRMDVRGRIFRRLMLPHYYLLPYLENVRQMPPRFHREGTVRNLLFERYLKKLLGDGTLDQLAAPNSGAPQLDILTTNLTRGSLAYFNGQVFVPSDDQSTPVPTRTTVARAVMASALFPAVFPTLELNAENLLADPSSLFPASEYFTDGGVYDNLGIRRFQTVLRGQNCPVDNVLVCDASGAFDWLIGRETLGYWKTALRSTDILMKRLADLEYEIARAAPNRFTFVRISDIVEPAAAQELPPRVQSQVKNVRTDLDRFTVAEIDAIVQHGYSVAARKLGELGGAPAVEQTPWRLFPNLKRPTESHAIRLLQRARIHSKNLFRWNDWASYVYPVLFLFFLGVGWRWYDSGRFVRYYNTLPDSQRTIVDRPGEPSAALREVKAAIARTSLPPETRFRVAILAYTLWISHQAPRELFDGALKQLGDRERVRFEEARWSHYYRALEKNTFGVPTIKEPGKAIDFINDAIPYVSPDLQVETALTSYGTFINVKNDKSAEVLARQSLSLLKLTLDNLDKPGVDRQLNDLNRFRARLLKGHYFLETGRLSSSNKEAEELYRKAAQTYAEAGRVSVFGEYWKVEYNRCNALVGAAEAAASYRNSSALATPGERDAVSAVIETTLDQALERCSKAQELAPAMNWQPAYLIGTILLKKNQPQLAAASFIRGYGGAQMAKEEESYIKYLAGNDAARSLCENKEFSRTFIRICRR